jgi:hypothetical protein
VFEARVINLCDRDIATISLSPSSPPCWFHCNTQEEKKEKLVHLYRKEKQQQLCIFFHRCLEPPAAMTTTPPLGVVGDLWLLLDLEFDVPVT